MKEIYEVTGNYGACIFHSREDAVSALWMVAQYHGMDLSREQAEAALERDGFYERFPLAVRECRA